MSLATLVRVWRNVARQDPFVSVSSKRAQLLS